MRSALPLLVMLCSCACASIKPAIATIDDVASDLCVLFAVDNESELGGLTPAQFCSIKENVQPFIDEALAAQQAGGSLALQRTDGK